MNALVPATAPAMGPVLFVGDPHGRLDHVVRAAFDENASAVVLLGDVQAQRSLEHELGAIADRLWFIHGNHDTDSERDFVHLWDSPLADRNVHGRVVVLPDGTRLAGLGGIFRSKVWDARVAGSSPAFHGRAEHARATPRRDRWRGSVSLRHWSTVYPEDFERLATLQADVLVTHEAPGYHPHGFAAIDELARAMGVKIAVHGHHHDALDSSDRWEEQGFRSYGVGQAGITAIQLLGPARIVAPGIGSVDSESDFEAE